MYFTIFSAICATQRHHQFTTCIQRSGVQSQSGRPQAAYLYIR